MRMSIIERFHMAALAEHCHMPSVLAYQGDVTELI